MCFYDYSNNHTIDKWFEWVFITYIVIKFPCAAGDVLIIIPSNTYSQTSNISRTEFQNLIYMSQYHFVISDKVQAELKAWYKHNT